MYECTICHNHNHSRRLHCSTCGTVPAMYSFNGKEYVPGDESVNCGRSIVVAHGCDRQEQHRAQRVNLKTVEGDYYAEGV